MVDYLFFNNIMYHLEGFKINEQEIIDFNINKIDKDEYNIILHNKYNKKFFLSKIEFFQLELCKFEKNNDYCIYLIFEKFTMFDIDIHNKKIMYNYLFLNDNISYTYINKFYNIKSNNDVLIIYYGSLKNYKNFYVFNKKFIEFINQKYTKSNIKYMYCLNNDIYNHLAYFLNSDISIILENMTENMHIYVSYMVYIFYKNILNINLSKIIIVNINHSILGLSSLIDSNIINNVNYYVDTLFNFCIFNEKDFIKLCNLFPQYLFLENTNFFNHILKTSNIVLKKIENVSVIKII